MQPSASRVIAHRIWTTLDESTEPVSAALLASRLKRDFAEVTENWNDCGTFRAFFRALKLSRLAWVREVCSLTGAPMLAPKDLQMVLTLLDETTLASRLVDQVLFLCAREQMVLDEAAVGHIRPWIAGAVAV